MSEKQQLQDVPPPPQDHVPFTSQTTSQSQAVLQQGPVWPTTQLVQVIPRNQPVILYDEYNSKRSRALGITQIVLGGVAFLVNFIGIIMNMTDVDEDYDGRDVDYYHEDYYFRETLAYYHGTGFWCTICCFLSGSFAICSARKKTKCFIITHIVFAILGSICAFIMLSLAIWAVGADAYRLEQGFRVSVYGDDISDNIYLYATKSEAKAKGAMFLSTLFLLVSIGEFIACVWSSTLCCKVLCCSTSSTVNYAAPAIQYAAHPSGQPQLLFMNSQGQAVHEGGMIQGTGPGYLAPTPVAQAPAYAPIAQEPTQAPDTGYIGQPFQYQSDVGQQTYPMQQGVKHQTYPTQQVGTPLQQEPQTPPPAYQ